jgi:predicted ATPase
VTSRITWLDEDVPRPEEIQRRLELIFPGEFDPRGWERASKVVFVMLYGFAIEGFEMWIRPTAVIDMSYAQAARTGAEERRNWLKLVQSKGRPREIPGRWYQENSRESIRDEALRTFVELNAVVERRGLLPTSSKPRYALARDFAELFAPKLEGEELNQAIAKWQEKHSRRGLGVQNEGVGVEDRWLSEVQIQRFKAAFEPPPIMLNPFNVVIGRNGSGKSTLLEALQWIDATIRRDAHEACDRYLGIRDLINLRLQASPSYFELILTWPGQEPAEPSVRYRVRVEDDKGAPWIAQEELFTVHGGRTQTKYLETKSTGERALVTGGAAEIPFSDPERLALGQLGAVLGRHAPPLAFLENFWARAVFLRLNPNRLAKGSLGTRKSFEPLLDEEGQNLPALLNELTPEQRSELVTMLQEILPGIRGVEVSRSDARRDTQINYRLLEHMPYRGRGGRSQFPIPSWMLSEGTRRITAILALLVREPAPSLLCIEEIENGLDPWTVRTVLRHLQSAADRGTQVILTTHSPWVLDDVPIESILQVRRIEGDTRYEHFASRPELADFDPSLPPGTLYVNIIDREDSVE